MIRIGNAQAFWGDRNEAASELLLRQPNLNYLTLDYLSEVSMSIMAIQRTKDPHAGYAKDFIEVISSLTPFWHKGSKVKLVTNAGGLDPKNCAKACADVLQKASCHGLRIAVVTGDDVIDTLNKNPENPLYHNLENGTPIATVLNRLTTANAYVGAKPLTEALLNGADIVIAGRIADPSLTVAPCIAEFGWQWDDYDKLAQATLAGHLIECGTQVTGGISTNWPSMTDIAHIGYPIVEVHQNGDFIITKPANTGGKVSIETVKEQILYEIGDPNAYLSPDVTMSLLSVSLKNAGNDRILTTGAKGKAPPTTYKVSATYQDGYKSEGSLVIFGPEAKAKAKLCGDIILQKMAQAGFAPERSLIEAIGAGSVVPGIQTNTGSETIECVLRICIADSKQEVLDYFSKQMAPLVTCGPQGTTGYTTGRPRIRPIFGFWPCLIDCTMVTPHIEYIDI